MHQGIHISGLSDTETQLACFNDVNAANQQIIVKEAGDFENLSINVTKNDDSNTRTDRIRVNSVDGNNSISISGNTTGFFEVTATDSVVVDDECDLVLDATLSSADIIISVESFTFDATTDTVCRYANEVVSSVVGLRYYAVNAGGLPLGSTSESDGQYPLNQDGKFSNLQCNITVNSKSATSTCNFRKNASTGNLSISIGSSVTGILIDSDEDTVVDTDDVCYLVDTSSGTGTLSMWMAVELITTDSKIFWGNWGNGSPVSISATLFFDINHQPAGSSTAFEVDTQIEAIGEDFVMKNTRIKIDSNTLGDSINKENADGDQSVGSWTDEGGATSNLFQSIDEESFDDADYVESELNPTTSAYQATLGDQPDPAISTGHIIRYRYGKDNTGQTVDIIVRLKQGTTTIASQTHSNVAVGFVAGSFTLSGAEADSITDYNDLRIEIEANTP